MERGSLGSGRHPGRAACENGSRCGDGGATHPETSRLVSKPPGDRGWGEVRNRRNPLCQHLGLEAPTRKTGREEDSAV